VIVPVHIRMLVARSSLAREAPSMVTGVVREWRNEEGWGVIDSDETPGDGYAYRAVKVVPVQSDDVA
jgi:hypothetical protein